MASISPLIVVVSEFILISMPVFYQCFFFFVDCDLEGCGFCSDKGSCEKCNDELTLGDDGKCSPAPISNFIDIGIIIGECNLLSYIFIHSVPYYSFLIQV